MNVETPRKSVPNETHHPVQRMRRYSQKCVLQSLARKVKKGRKNNPVQQNLIETESKQKINDEFRIKTTQTIVCLRVCMINH